MGWGTAQNFYNYSRKVQAWVSASIASSTNTSATITITSQARSGDGSGYYYAADWAAYIQAAYKIGSGSYQNAGSQVYAVLNYGNAVPSGSTKSRNITITKAKSAQTITCRTSVTSSANSSPDWPTATSTVDITVPALPSYSVTYNANGGSGAPASQTKWYNEALALQSGTPTRTGYTFSGWATSATATAATYFAGSAYTGNAALTLYAVWTKKTYSITYNGNKPSAASGTVTNVPANQTKEYGTNISLSSTKPVLSLYTFKEWNTLANGTGTSYSPGATYSSNNTLTLYAQWKLAYIYPKITSITVQRATSEGTADPNGTYAKVSFAWKVDTSVISGNTGRNYTIAYKRSDQSAYTNIIGATNVALSGTGTTTVKTVGMFETGYSYSIRVTVMDNHEITSGVYGAAVSYATLSPTFFTLDFLNGGKGLAIGKEATETGFTVAMAQRIEGSGFSLKSTDITSNVAVSETVNGNSHFYIRDSAGASLGFIGPVFTSSGVQRTRFYSSRAISGTTYYNGFYLGIDSSGNPVVGFHNNNCKTAWLDGLGIGSIGLKDSLAASDITSGTLPLARGGTGSTTVTTILANTTRTVLAWGPLVMVQLHGATGTPGSSTVLNSGTLASYKPNPEYNISALVGDTAGHVARLWVNASNGNICLASMGYTTSSSWYGTLVYLRK